jgi:hypothetical protein
MASAGWRRAFAAAEARSASAGIIARARASRVSEPEIVAARELSQVVMAIR